MWGDGRAPENENKMMEDGWSVLRSCDAFTLWCLSPEKEKSVYALLSVSKQV